MTRLGPRRLPPKNEVLDVLASDDRAFHPHELAERLDVPQGSYDALVALLDDMALNGQLVARPGNKYKLAKADAKPRGEEREGFLSVNARGFGFVASLGASKKREDRDDVYVQKESMKGAMHGDKVVVRVRSRGSRGVEGEIITILERRMSRVAGVLRRRGRSVWLEPDDTRVRGPITLSEQIDAKEGEGNSGKDGDAAIVVITRWPELPDETPEGKLEAVLGRPGELKVEVAKILAMAGIDEVHSQEAFDEAEAYGKTVPPEMLEGREDLTHLPLPTIDPEDARDHDDAVWVERTESGGYKATIAIADVSSYVRPGTKLDAESMKRGVSVYLPDRAIPMLPRPLSSNLCSLLPDVIRLCLAIEATLDSSGKLKRVRVIRGFMKSQAKLTYGGVARALGFTSEPPRDPKAEEMIDGLRVANELSRILRGRRMARGALDFDLPEAKLMLDAEGNPTDVQKRSGDPGMKKAYQLIEELMLLANETVAEWLVAQKVPTIFRVHAQPDEEKLARLETVCETLGVPFDIEDAKEPKKLAAIVASFAAHPQSHVLNMLVLRAMKQATYDVTNIGHFGLASKAYVHFTSPIRRYPDLVVHRGVHAQVMGPEEKSHKSPEMAAKLGDAALAASVAERKAMEVEREVVDLYRAILMRDRIGQRYEGNVTALVGSGIFVQLDSPFVDVLVKLEDLGGDRWELDEETMRVFASRSGQSISLGDRIMVEIIDSQILRRTVYGKRVPNEAEGEGRAGDKGDKGEKSGSYGAKAYGAKKSGPGDKRWNAKKTDKQVRAGKRKIEGKARPGQASKGKGGGKRKGGKRK